jgi:hypothetical protein
LSFLAAAFTAAPKNLVTVPERRELELAADLVLKSFDCGVGKFNNIAAVHTDHVVVVRPSKLMFIALTAVWKKDFTGEPSLFQQVKSAKNRGPTEQGVLGSQVRVDPFWGSMVVGAEKII